MIGKKKEGETDLSFLKDYFLRINRAAKATATIATMATIPKISVVLLDEDAVDVEVRVVNAVLTVVDWTS